MLGIHAPADRHRDPRSRREFLSVGSLGLAGLGLGSLSFSQLLALRALAAERGAAVRERSVVVLFLQGGPPHIETFDPKMEAPREIRSIFGEIPTSVPGLTFGSHFPQLAKLAHRFSVVRSFASGNSGHTYGEVMSARNRTGATAGALYSRVVGASDPETALPSSVLVTPEAVEPGLKLGRNFETSALPTLTAPGSLGETHRAFDPAGGSELKENMELRVPESRLLGRRELLRELDGLRRQIDVSEALANADGYRRQAFDVITSGAARAFDLSDEDPRVVERYETSHIFDNPTVQRWGDMRRSTNLLGRQMLLARRLCEAGCGFVTVSDCGWDMHSNGNSPKGLGGMKWLGPQVDHAVAAFIEDVEARGLSDRILLVVTGEMERTPRINKNGGRDHYGNLTPLLLHGGGLPARGVIGRSDRGAAVPATRRYGPENLLATIWHSLFDIGELRLSRSVPSEVLDVITGAEPIAELV